MGARVNCQRLEADIRAKIADPSGGGINVRWTSTQILEAIDNALQEMFAAVRMTSAGYDRDFQDIPLASFALSATETNVYTFSLPEYVSEVELVELIGATQIPTTIEPAELWHKDSGRAGYGGPRWNWSGGRSGGRFEIRGRLLSGSTVRVWFVRRWPPMSYGLAASGGASTLVLSAAPTAGRNVLRDDLYIGVDVELTNNSPAGVQDQIRRVSDYVASTRTLTVDPAWGTAPDNTTTYALVVPVEPEHTEYVALLASRALLERDGNVNTIQAMAPRMAQYQARMIQSLRKRVSAAPKRFFSSRY